MQYPPLKLGGLTTAIQWHTDLIMNKYYNNMAQPTFCKKLVLSGLLFLTCSQQVSSAEELPASMGFGLDTMAPEGRWAARLELRSNQYDSRYDNSGKRQDIDAAFNGVNLNAGIFPAFALLGSDASLGITKLDTKVKSQFSILTIGYGVTPDLTLGAIIPYSDATTHAKFTVNGGNVGYNPGFNPSMPVGIGNFPFAPAGGAIAPMGTAGVQNILTNPAFGYGYKQVRTTSSAGLGDPTLGFLWRFHKTPQESAILGLGVRFGISKKDDPDNLLDIPPGDGSTDIRARFEYFRDLAAGLDLHLLADYNFQTADRVTMRVPAPGQLLALSSSKEKLRRDLGDYYETDIELGYRWSDWRFSATWHRYEEGRDHYRSSLGTDIRSLEMDTHTIADQYRLSVAWSGINAWQQGRLPLPLILKLEMQDTFAGRNFVDVRDFYVQIMSFF